MDDAPKHDVFTERYATGDTPWDTNITPPEIVAVMDELPAGHALDLGCGTGTNVIALADKGWHAVGIDYVGEAIESARRKAKSAEVAERTSFHVGDVRKADTLGLPLMDLVIDMGCGHIFEAAGFPAYMGTVARLIKPGGVWMLYIHHYEVEHDRGLEPDVVHAHAAPEWVVREHVTCEDSSMGGGASWFRLQRL